MEEDKLATYIVDDLFKWMADERRNQLEDQMNRNYDAFRGRYDSAVLKKWKSTEGKDWRSRVFVRLTKQKVVAGFNQVAANVTRGNDLLWGIDPTPIPEQSQGVMLDPETAKVRCSAMKQLIQDNFTEGMIVNPVLSSLLERAIYGWSWIFGPVLRREMVANVDFGVPGSEGMYLSPELVARYGRHTLRINEQLRLMTENPGVWNTFWDMENPDPNKGHGIIVRDMMSKGRFMALANTPGYDSKEINRIYKEYGDKDFDGEDEDDSQAPIRQEFSRRKRVIPVYISHVRVPRDKLEGYIKRTTNEIRGFSSTKGQEIDIQCVCVKGRGKKNATVIKKPVVNFLPYRRLYLAKWEHLPGEGAGVGVPENMEDSQMIVNGLMRAMLDNKALSSNLMVFLKAQALAPGQNKGLYPGKVWYAHEGVEDVRQAMQWFNPQDITGNTPKLIEMVKQFADEETGLPKTLEGQRTDARTTAYEISKMTESGNKLIGGTVRNHDQGCTLPLVRGYYHWHMMTSRDENIKGDYQVKAKGMESYIEKVRRGQDLLELFSVAVSSEAAQQFTKVAEFLREMARVRDMDPDRFFATDDELTNHADELSKLLPTVVPGQGPVNA